MNEFEAHESSYDHQHKKRFMEMKQMQKGASSIEARRERERRAEEKAGLITIKPIKLGSSSDPSGEHASGKRGFKSAFGNVDANNDVTAAKSKAGAGFKKAFSTVHVQGFDSSIKDTETLDDDADPLESDTEDEGYERYNPAQPTT